MPRSLCFYERNKDNPIDLALNPNQGVHGIRMLCLPCLFMCMLAWGGSERRASGGIGSICIQCSHL